MNQIEVADLRPSKEIQEFFEFTPILDRVLLSRVESDKDKSGFTIPDKYREPESKGIVVAIGDGITLGGHWHPMSEFLNVGDEVLFGSYTAEKVELEAKEYEIVRLQDIRGVRRVKRLKCLESDDISGAGVLDRIAGLRTLPNGISAIKVGIATLFVVGQIIGIFSSVRPNQLRGYVTISSIDVGTGTVTIIGELPPGTEKGDLLVVANG